MADVEGWPDVRWPPPADPFDEDGYCDFCGNGKWKSHAPWCRWADLRDWLLGADRATRDPEEEGDMPSVRNAAVFIAKTINALCDELVEARKVLQFADGLAVAGGEGGFALADLYAVNAPAQAAPEMSAIGTVG